MAKETRAQAESRAYSPGQISDNEANTLATNISQLGLATGSTSQEVINNWLVQANKQNNPVAYIAPVIQAYAPKIAEMYFYSRTPAYGGKIRSVLDDMFDKDLIYGAGREYSIPNFVPVKDFDPNQFVPPAVTTPVETVCTITVDRPKQVSLTLQADLYKTAVNNGGNLGRLISTLRESHGASFSAYLENVIIDDWILKYAKSPQTEDQNDTINTTRASTKVMRYVDTRSNNTKECFTKLEELLYKMTSQATNLFNIGGTSSKAFVRSEMDDIKILCSAEFYAKVRYGLLTGLFKPELVGGIVEKLVPLPDYKLSLPANTNTSASTAAWTNALEANNLIIVNTKMSFKFGMQLKSTGEQFYKHNEALQLTTNFIPYFGALSMGQMFVYKCDNLGTLPCNPMGNVA